MVANINGLSLNTTHNISWDNQKFLEYSEASGYLYQEVPIMDGMSGSRILRNGHY
jgi:hypothetical protein